MEKPNLNTFAPRVSDTNPGIRKGIGFEKGDRIVVIGAGAFGGSGGAAGRVSPASSS